MFLVIFIPSTMRGTIFIPLTIRWMIADVCLPFHPPTMLWSRGRGRASSSCWFSCACFFPGVPAAAGGRGAVRGAVQARFHVWHRH
jgi:hypothetical protein